MSAVLATHIVPCNALPIGRSQYRALCGAIVERWQHVTDGNPTCAECKRIDDEATKDLAAMQANDPESEAEASR